MSASTLPTTTIVTLTNNEAARLADLEGRIEQGLASFIEVGEALSAIRDARLYRTTHGTFENYCAEKWGMSKRHCDRLISSAEVVQSLGPIGPKIESESQARELSRVEPEHRAAVVEKAIQATGGKLTAPAIKAAAVEVEIVPDSPPSYPSESPYRKWQRESYGKRKPSPPPARTEEELVYDLVCSFEHSGFLRDRRGVRPHADDLARIPRLLVRAWNEAVKDDEEQTRLEAEYLKERDSKTEEAAK